MPAIVFSVLWNVGLATILAMLVAVVCRLRPLRHRPALVQMLWLLVLVKLVTPPLIPVPMLSYAQPEKLNLAEQEKPAGTSRLATGVPEPRSVSLQSTPVEVSPTILEFPSNQEVVSAAPVRELPWQFLLAVISACGTLILAIFSVSRFLRVRRILSRAASDNERVKKLAEIAADRMGLRRSPRVCAVDAPIVPFLWVRRTGPVIVLPTKLIDPMSDEQVTCILCHELAHYVRKDHWSNLFACFVVALFWWFPIAWCARRQMRAAQEVCCDGLVLETKTADRRCYAETLFQALEFVQTCRPLRPSMASGFGDSSSLKRRFQIIATLNVKSRVSWSAVMLAVVGVIVMLCIPVRGQPPAARQDGEEAKQPMGNEEKLRVLIDKVLSAHGGEDKLNKLTSFIVTVKHSNGEMQHYFVQPPNNLRWETTHRDSTSKRIVILFPEGRRWWKKAPNEDAREFIPTGIEPLRIEGWFDYVKFFGPRQVLRLKDVDHKVSLLDEEAKIGDRAAVGVQVTGPEYNHNMYFDKETHLLLKSFGVNLREATYGEYKKLGGLPIAQKEHDGYFEADVADFRVVDKFDAELFENPDVTYEAKTNQQQPVAGKDQKQSEENQPLETVTVRGKVVDDATGEPIERLVTQSGSFDPADPTKVTWGGVENRSSARDGSFSATVRWAEGWTYRILADGYIPQPVLTSAPPAGKTEIRVTIRLKRGRNVRGVVLDHSGKPLQDAAVFVVGPTLLNLAAGQAWRHDGMDEYARPVRTDEQGRFELPVGEATSLAVSHAQFDAWPAAIPPSGEVTIQLPEPARVEIDLDIDGADEESMIFYQLLAHDVPEFAGVQSSREVTIANPGKLSLAALPPGKYQLCRNVMNRLKGVGMVAMLERQYFELQPGETKVIHYVREQGARVRGKVTWPADPKVMGIVISIQEEKPQRRPSDVYEWRTIYASHAAEADGAFLTERIAPGAYLLLATAYTPLKGPPARLSTGRPVPWHVAQIKIEIPADGELNVGKLALKPIPSGE